MHKYGERIKRLKLWWQLYVTWPPVRDLEKFRPMDFCSTECTFTSEQPQRSFSCTCLMSWNNWAFINTHCLPRNVPFLGIFPLLLSAFQLLTCAILSRDFCNHENIILCVLPNLGLWAFESIGFVLFDVFGFMFQLLLRKKTQYNIKKIINWNRCFIHNEFYTHSSQIPYANIPCFMHMPSTDFCFDAQ